MEFSRVDRFLWREPPFGWISSGLLLVVETLEGLFPVVQSLRPPKFWEAVLGALQRLLRPCWCDLFFRHPEHYGVREGRIEHGKDTGRSRTDNGDT